MTIKTVIFDLDGTIASFNTDYTAIRTEVRNLLMNIGLPDLILPTKGSIFEMLDKAEIYLKSKDTPEEEIGNTRKKALAIAEKYELEAAKTTSLLSGVIETLESVKEMHMKIGLCTINSETSTYHILERFGIKDFFDAVVPRNKVTRVKPNIEHLETALKALGSDPFESIFVGDSVRDMQCARELGVIAVGLPTGFSTQKELITAGANYFMTSITDLPTLINAINEASKS
ncbi:HAD family hydrolase [Candidatus Bathyarchaeota archaeon]|nr:HAD family hydrolase [Candidatus Bathyarchaeota archaeon]